MTAEELKRLRVQLQAERDRLIAELGYMEDRILRNALREASGDLSGYASHQADVGTDAEEREKAALLTSAEGRLLIAIHTALDRIDSGRFGICETCGGDIGVKRLEAIPSATQCIACKERDERNTRVHA